VEVLGKYLQNHELCRGSMPLAIDWKKPGVMEAASLDAKEMDCNIFLSGRRR